MYRNLSYPVNSSYSEIKNVCMDCFVQAQSHIKAVIMSLYQKFPDRVLDLPGCHLGSLQNRDEDLLRDVETLSDGIVD